MNVHRLRQHNRAMQRKLELVNLRRERREIPRLMQPQPLRAAR